MKFKDVIKGTRAVRTIPFPLFQNPDSTEPQKAIDVGLRPLNGTELADVLEQAAFKAKEKGVAEPKAGDPLYDFWLQVHTIFLGCVDPDDPKPESSDARFFSSIDEILSAPNLGRDGIAYLYEAQEAWQAHCSPGTRNEDQSFWGQVTELAATNDPLGFAALHPTSRWIFARSMAVQLLSLLQSKSPSGQPGESATSTASPSESAKP